MHPGSRILKGKPTRAVLMKAAQLQASALILMFLSALTLGQDKKPHPKPITPQQEAELRAKNPLPTPHPTFYIDQVSGLPGSFGLLLSDANNRSVAGTFRLAQLEIFDAILSEGLKFAETEEEIGKTTRFADKNEKGLSVDVQKTAKESLLFVTLSYLGNTITVEAGKIVRADRNERKWLAGDILKAIRNAKATS